MYSTQKNIEYKPPNLHQGVTCGTRLMLGGAGDHRIEGGLRYKGCYKISRQNLPLVTIITVAANAEKTIEQSILSVLEQTYENIEYIIVDGASADGTLDLIRKYESAIDYYISEQDEGIYNAMNKGLSLATGGFILILNSDDWYRRDAVKILLDHAVKSGADITHADANIVNAHGLVYQRVNAWLHDGLYTRGAPLRHETMLIKADIYNKFGKYDESYHVISDYDYMVRLYSGSCSFKHVTEPLLYFRDTGVSNIDNEKRHADRARFFGQLFPFLDNDDLSIMKRQGRLSADTRLRLIDKHKGKSELFERSMIRNIVDNVVNEPSKHKHQSLMHKLICYFNDFIKYFKLK